MCSLFSNQDMPSGHQNSPLSLLYTLLLTVLGTASLIIALYGVYQNADAITCFGVGLFILSHIVFYCMIKPSSK